MAKARKMKVTKIGEVSMKANEIKVGRDSLESIIMEAIPDLKNLEDAEVFSGKITIVIEEIDDCQNENTFRFTKKNTELSVVNE